MSENNRFKELINYLIANKKVRNQQQFVEEIHSDKATVSQVKNGKIKIPNNMFASIEVAYPYISTEWLIYGEGEMLKSDNSVQFYNPDVAPANRRLIPLYDEVSTIGGNNEVMSNSSSGNVAEWIDPGDWFRNATHAIRHYEDSMVEYPSGCILAMKEVLERELVVWGRDYVIETDEYRITKRVQRGDTPDSIKAYSSNLETYPDGRLIHEPIDIQWCNVRKIFLVLGYVVKKGSGTIVFSDKK